MSGYVISPIASIDLDEMWDYCAIELQNPDVADRIRDEVFTAFRQLAIMPGMGHFRSDLAAEPLRFWRVRNYLVVYRSEKTPIEIVRVLHGARDAQVILGDYSAI